MDAVTYPDPDVDAFLTGQFTGFKLCLTEKHPDFKEAALGRPVPWAPTFLFEDGRGREVRRTVGWLDARAFLGELHLAGALFELGRWRVGEALERLERTASEFANTPAGPEAGYYAGVAIFLQGKRDMPALRERWNRLRADHPESDWATKASVIDDWSPG